MTSSLGAGGTRVQVFPSTHWSIVLTAGDATSPRAQESLEKLCRTYWYPIYAMVRHRGHSPEDSEDYVQGFFDHILEKEVLNQVNQDKGRFRSFLLVCLSHYLNNECHRTQA